MNYISIKPPNGYMKISIKLTNYIIHALFKVLGMCAFGYNYRLKSYAFTNFKHLDLGILPWRSSKTVTMALGVRVFRNKKGYPINFHFTHVNYYAPGNFQCFNSCLKKLP